MRARLILAVLPALLTMILAGPVVADWYVERATETAADSRRPTGTFDRDNDLHLLWEEGGNVLHRIRYVTGWTPIDIIGAGSGYDHWTCWN